MKRDKVALITGATGQDGFYLAEFLLEKGYVVHGIKRKSSSYNTGRVDNLLEGRKFDNRYTLHYGDMTDTLSLVNIISRVRPSEIYNLAAQSHVAVSFDLPEYTASVDALGFLRLLEAVRFLGLEKTTRIYQAGTSELFGAVLETPQSEITPFNPQSPYAVAKLYAHWIGKCYRDSYGMFVVNGILFNHESPLRGETFVTRKITLGLAKVLRGEATSVRLGNLEATRDWGHAKDFVRAQWMMLQRHRPEDFVIATGYSYSVREFCEKVAEKLGISLTWSGSGLEEVGRITSISNTLIPETLLGQAVISVSEKYFRPLEVQSLRGDASRAARDLGWTPNISFEELVSEMVIADIGEFVQ